MGKVVLVTLKQTLKLRIANKFVVRSRLMEERRELLRKTSGKNVGSCNAEFLSVCRSRAVGQNLMPNDTSC